MNQLSKKIELSIVIITHNRCKMLVEALSSLLSQKSDKSHEIIVVDNASPDNTVKVVKKEFPMVKLLSTNTNLGVSGARNIGVENANGDIVIFMDDDALIEGTDMFLAVSDIFDKNPNIAVTAFRIVNHGTNKMFKHEFPMKKFTQEDMHTQHYVSYFVGCGFALRRDIFLKLGGFFTEMFYGPEEVDFSYRVLDAGYDILYYPKVTIRHRTPPQVRRREKWYYNSIRSRILMAMRNLPLWALIPFLFIWHFDLLIRSIKTGDLGWFMKGVTDGWHDVHIAIKKEK